MLLNPQNKCLFGPPNAISRVCPGQAVCLCITRYEHVMCLLLIQGSWFGNDLNLFVGCDVRIGVQVGTQEQLLVAQKIF